MQSGGNGDADPRAAFVSAPRPRNADRSRRGPRFVSAVCAPLPSPRHPQPNVPPRLRARRTSLPKNARTEPEKGMREPNGIVAVGARGAGGDAEGRSRPCGISAAGARCGAAGRLAAGMLP